MTLRTLAFLIILLGCGFHLTAVGSGMNPEEPDSSAQGIKGMAIDDVQMSKTRMSNIQLFNNRLKKRGLTVPGVSSDTEVKMEELPSGVPSQRRFAIPTVQVTKTPIESSSEEVKKMTENCALKFLGYLACVGEDLNNVEVGFADLSLSVFARTEPSLKYKDNCELFDYAAGIIGAGLGHSSGYSSSIKCIMQKLPHAMVELNAIVVLHKPVFVIPAKAGIHD